MKRLFEYAVAENQTIDSGYLDHLTRQFERESAINSSEAMKNAFVRIVQSRSFRERNPEPQRCYDHGPDANRDNAPPCRVAYILQKNCAQCHSGANAGATRLDLTSWVPGPDGKHHTFPYFDTAMNQKSMEEALAALLDRLSSNDPAVRMPLATAMPSPERQELFLWAQEMLATAAKENAR
jgi:hypothetical protein